MCSRPGRAIQWRRKKTSDAHDRIHIEPRERYDRIIGIGLALFKPTSNVIFGAVSGRLQSSHLQVPGQGNRARRY